MAFPSGTPSFLLVAMNATLEDTSFKPGSEVAAHAREAAETLSVWCENETNEGLYTQFSRLLQKQLEGAVPTNVTLNRENVWKLFFKLRSSNIFNVLWTSFLQRIEVSPTPVLYQHLTDIVFQMLHRNRFDCSATAASVSPETSTMKGFSLRYAAGYVACHVLIKIRASNLPHKDDLISNAPEDS